MRREGAIMVSEAQKRAHAKYQQEKVKKKLVRFFPKDKDLLEHLEKQPSQNSYILDLIRRDMESR